MIQNVKLWGLDFGDCHKSLFAHSDSVMAVKFLPKTHYFFTAGKDGVVKYWDGDRFSLILELEVRACLTSYKSMIDSFFFRGVFDV